MESTMMRWFRQRRLWAGVFATTAAFGLAFGQGGMDAPSGPPKVGDVITLPFPTGERQFKVLKVDKQPDGTYLSDMKDTKTGETITYFIGAGDAPAKQPEPMKGKEPLLPKLQPRPNDPLLSPIFPQDNSYNKNQPTSSAKTNTSSGAATMPDTPPDPPKRPGLLSRIFGPKKPTPPANTNSPTATTPPPMVAPPSMAMPPTVRPTPGLFPSPPGGTTEPPRILPVQPVAPPTPLFPTAPPVAPATPFPPAPMIPGLPSIPIPPGGMSSNLSGVIQARYVSPVATALIQEVQPYVITLRTARAPSERIYALRALAGCRHASTDTVKSVLFRACTTDPCGLVRACCIDELCTLGYFDPAFLAHLKNACDDPSEDVRNSAKAALIKMSPQR
jgi:hypothetical protein